MCCYKFKTTSVICGAPGTFVETAYEKLLMTE